MDFPESSPSHTGSSTSIPVLQPAVADRPVAQLLPVEQGSPEPRRGGARTFLVPGLLFGAACVTTWLSGGVAYALCLMSILLAHELGHYIQTLRYGVPATPPMFIPVPFGFGTMGAVIVQRGHIPNRSALFDIGVSGPLAGLAVAIPLMAWCVSRGSFAVVPAGATVFGDPLLVKMLIWWFHGPQPAGQELLLDGIGIACWVGFLITGVNLMPFGQLDGGHVLYCLIGRGQHKVASVLFKLVLGAIVIYGLFVSWDLTAWLVMLTLVGWMGLRHPPTLDDDVPIGRTRTAIGWLTMASLPLLFIPIPISMSSANNPSPPKAVQQALPLGTAHQ